MNGIILLILLLIVVITTIVAYSIKTQPSRPYQIYYFIIDSVNSRADEGYIIDILVNRYKLTLEQSINAIKAAKEEDQTYFERNFK